MKPNENKSLAQKIGSIALGLILIALAIWLYTWSKSQRDGASETLTDILGSYRDLSDGGNSAVEDYPFAYLQGNVETQEELFDELFGLRVQGLFFRRTVLQLVRVVDERTEGGRNIVSYEWSGGGEFPLISLRLQPVSVNLEGFTVSSQLLDWLTEGETIRCDDERFTQSQKFNEERLICRADGEFSNKGDDESYEEGDIRVSFSYLPLGPVSLIGKLAEGTLYAIEDVNETYLYLFEPGFKTPEELVDTMQTSTNNNMRISIWFSLGVFLLGLFLCLAPFNLYSRLFR